MRGQTEQTEHSYQSSAREVSDGACGQEDRTPHDERDTQQPEARRSISSDPLVEVVELGIHVLQHGSVPLRIEKGDGCETESSINSGFGASIDALFFRERERERESSGILVVA